MRIFITGLSGFIGKNLRNKFSQEDKILSLSRRIDPKIDMPNLKQIEGEISNPSLWKKQVLNFSPECCIHLAWQGIPDFSLSVCRENISHNLIFLESLVEMNIKNLIVAGSCWEYGECSGEISENFNSNNPSLFGLSKLAILSFIKRIAYENDINYKWARMFFVYGPYQRENSLIPSIRKDIIKNENNIKYPESAQDFIFVEDVVKAILQLTDININSGIYNIGSNKLVSVGHIANIIYSYYGKEIPYPNINKKIKGFYSDNRKLKNIINFKIENNLNLGLNKTLNFLDNY